VTDLSEEEKARVAAQVDYFLSLMAQRYDVKPSEMITLVQEMRERRAFYDRVKSTGLVSLVGLVATAIMLAIWEGLKSLISQGR
jgi:hypothetical protein